MPCLCLETNVPESAFDLDGFSTELASAIESSLGKPINYVMVSVKPGVCLTFGSAKDRKKPAAYATLMSIGQLGVEQNKKHSANLFPVIKKHLNVESDRCYILFQDAKSSDVGFKGTTFHEIMGK